jgi:regulator of protease activity HflC (stomatin/prohibitin superfamily)
MISKKRGLVLEQLLIRNINLPSSVKASIESKINAEQDAQKMTFVLQKEKQEAERKRVEAQGIADYQRIISSGLTDKQLQYEQIKAQKEIATSSNAKIIFMGKGVLRLSCRINSLFVSLRIQKNNTTWNYQNFY